MSLTYVKCVIKYRQTLLPFFQHYDVNTPSKATFIRGPMPFYSYKARVCQACGVLVWMLPAVMMQHYIVNIFTTLPPRRTLGHLLCLDMRRPPISQHCRRLILPMIICYNDFCGYYLTRWFNCSAPHETLTPALHISKATKTSLTSFLHTSS
jgi:hypothetical protein